MRKIIDALSGSIRVKLVLLTAVPIFVIFIIFEIYGSSILLDDAESARRLELINSARLMSTRLDREFSYLSRITRSNASQIETGARQSEAEIYALARNTLDLNPMIFGAAIAFDRNAYSPERELFAPYAYRQAGEVKTLDIGDADPVTGYDYTDGNWSWWSEPRATGASGWSAPYFDEGAGNILMTTYSVPFFGDDRFLGVATVDVELATLFYTLELTTGNRIIVDGQGEFIFHPRPDFVLNRNLQSLDGQYDSNDIESLLSNIQAGGQGMLYFPRVDRDDRDWVAFYPIPSTDWYYVEFDSERAILAPVRHLQLISILKATFAIVAVLAVIWLISGVLTAPVMQLSKAAHRVSQGDFSVRLTSASRDELGRLIRIFTSMSDMISNREYELAHKVEERTQELRLSQREIELQKKELENRVEELKILTVELEAARNQAEVASESKANFLASMSHEIRTPLNGVLGMVDLLRQSDLQPEHQKMLQTISSSGQSLLTIINDILDISKIEAGKMDLEEIPFNLVDVVESSAETVNINATGKGLTLYTYIDPAMPRRVLGDPVRIRQILINLIGNGIKFTQAGSVSIEVCLNRKEQGDTPDQVLFAVRDTGIGISREGQSRLFKAFSQAESSTTRKYGGTGLGLSICERLTTMMDGRIWVESEEGHGATFCFSLPLKPVEDQETVVPGDDLSDLHILIISWHETEQLAFRRYLEYWKATTHVIDSLEQGVAEVVRADSGPTPYQIVVFGSGFTHEEVREAMDSMEALPLAVRPRFVRIAKGRRTKPRLEGGNVVVDLSPLKRAGFLTAVAIAAGRQSPEIYHPAKIESLRAERGMSVEQALARNQLILVAEDNATNRDVIGRQLSHLGYACEFAEDGELALEAWKTGRYTIILSDCHMPNMDGFELTAAIRAIEAESGRRRTPILAITANALAGEDQKCLDAGMDDYMSKPVDMKILRTKIRQWMSVVADPAIELPGESTPSPGADPEEGRHPSGAVDPQVLKSMFGDDESVFRDILRDYVDPSRQVVAEIHSAVNAGMAADVQQAAHKLKSASRSIGANSLADLCYRLESAGKAGDMDTISREAADLDRSFQEVINYIDGVVKA